MQSLTLAGSACATLQSYTTSNAACRAFASRSADFTTRPWYSQVSARPTPNSATRWGTGWPDGPIAAVTTSTATTGLRPGYSAPHRWLISGMPFTISIGVTAMLPDDRYSDARYLSALGTGPCAKTIILRMDLPSLLKSSNAFPCFPLSFPPVRLCVHSSLTADRCVCVCVCVSSVHTDLSIPSVQKFVQIGAGKTGVAHLFQTSGKVVASNMWDIATDSSYGPNDGLEWERVKNGVDIDGIKIIGPDDFESLEDIPTFGEAQIRQRISELGGNSGSFTVDDKYEVVFAKVGTNKDFVTCAVTRQVEILEAISNQIEQIDSEANQLFVSVLVAVLVIGSLLVVVAVVLAIRISGPLVSTAENAEQMAQNIGDDLLKGLNVDEGDKNTCCGISEIDHLKTAFEGLVHQRKALHSKVQQTEANPFFGQSLELQSAAPVPWTKAQAPGPTGINSATASEKTSLIAGPDLDDGTKPPHRGCKLWVWLYSFFVIPVAIACIVITVVTAVRVTNEAKTWTDPVEYAMVDEALKSIQERTALRAELVGITLSSCINALRLSVDVSEGILDGQVATTAATTGFVYKSPYAAPRAACYGSQSDFACPTLVSEPVATGREGRETGLISYRKSGWFAPSADLLQDYDFVTEAQGSWSSVSDADVQDVTKRFAEDVLPAIDVVNRIAYMSYPVDSIYFGYFGQPSDRSDDRAVPPEMFSQYPYSDMSGMATKSLDCNEGTGGDITPTRTSAYTPICRPWFWDVWKAAARDNPTPIPVASRPATFHGLGLGSDNGQPFLSLAMPLYKGSKLVGVAAVDAALGQISTVLSTTPLLDNGYAYLIDRQGMVRALSVCVCVCATVYQSTCTSAHL